MKIRIVIPVMLLLLAVIVVIATALGSVPVPFMQTVRIILKNWGIGTDGSFSGGQESIIYFVRFPRVIVAMLVGAALSTSGAVMQGMFRNPMADPGIIGVSSGAGLGAVIAIVFGLSARNMFMLPLFASTGSIAAAFLIFLLSRKGGRVQSLTLILAGIAVSTLLGAITNIFLTMAYDYQVREFMFWVLGDLYNRQWEHAGLIFIPVIVCILILFTFSRDLNILMLGEEEAQSVGLNPSRTRIILLFLVCVTTASAVCVSGIIGFVGLIVPHILRLIAGPDHRILLPASAIGGAVFLVSCDLVSRLLIMPGEIRVGIITSLLGAPYFLYLLHKNRREGGVFQ